MEITLEKIELVKDRTGVSYKEAKEALEAAEGSVVDAIIAIEETINLKGGNKATEFADDTIERIKELVKKGNVTKISVKRDDETIVNIPVNVGLVGTLVAPWGVIAAAIAAFGFKCKIELTKDDGSIIDISARAEVLAADVKEKGAVVMDEVVAKGTAVYEDAKDKAPDYVEELKGKSVEVYNQVKDVVSEKWNEIKEKKDDFEIEVECFFDEAEEKLEDLAEKAEDKIEEVEAKIEEKLEK